MSKLLFICGFPSGGTDLTRTILNAHPEVYISGEMQWLKDIGKHNYDQHTTFNNITDIGDFQELLRKWDRWGEIENLSHDFTSELRTQKTLSLENVLKVCFLGNDSKVWGNKTPQNTENIDTLLKLFPKAYFLIITRDVRDVCLSWNKKWGRNMAWCAAKWNFRMAKGKTCTDNLAQDRYMYVKFEDLLKNNEQSCREICAFLELDFSESITEHYNYNDELKDGKVNYAQPIKPGNCGKWKKELPPNTVKRLEEISFNTMKQFNYNISYAKKHKPISLWEIIFGFINDAYSILIVGNRYSKNNKLSKRLKEIQNLIFWRFINNQNKH